MGYIEKIKIKGFKKFKDITIEFNKDKNILIGCNEAGKSSILEAINIVLNQYYRNADKSILQDLLNIDNIKFFLNNSTIENLPSIQIELFLNMDENPWVREFYGENYSNYSKSFGEKMGVSFECKFDEESYGDELREKIEQGNLPLEYYQMSWSTFAGRPYKVMKKPIKSLLIDTSAKDLNASFNYFNKSLLKNRCDKKQLLEARNSFRNDLKDVFEKINLEEIDKDRKFGVNSKKIMLENIISIFENDIALENKGRGIENLIKTKVSLDKNLSRTELVMIEEPENHLSHNNLLKMIDELVLNTNTGQLIITTHNDLIAARLDLKNVIWITDNESKTLNTLDAETTKFFVKAANNNLLQFLLAEKVFLVEGPTENLLIPELYKKENSSSLTEDKISIINCGGVEYKRYLKIAEHLEKKVAVITDNDKSKKKVEFKNKYNSEHENIKIFMDEDIQKWTWEACMYESNTELLEKKIQIEPKAEYKFNGERQKTKTLGRMLNNKVEIAYQMLEWVDDLNVPIYLREAFTWIKS